MNLLALRGRPAAVAGAHGQRCSLRPFPKPSASTLAADTVTTSLGSLSLWLLLDLGCHSDDCAHHQGLVCCQSVSSWSRGDVPVESSPRTCLSCHSGDYHSCRSSCPLPREGPVGTSPLCLRCSAHVRGNCCLPSFCCAVLHDYQLISALCLECLTETLSAKENFSPFSLELG